jgi:hypothetical protein
MDCRDLLGYIQVAGSPDHADIDNDLDPVHLGTFNRPGIATRCLELHLCKYAQISPVYITISSMLSVVNVSVPVSCSLSVRQFKNYLDMKSLKNDGPIVWVYKIRVYEQLIDALFQFCLRLV